MDLRKWRTTTPDSFEYPVYSLSAHTVEFSVGMKAVADFIAVESSVKDLFLFWIF